MNIRKLRNLRHVNRFNFHPVLHKQNVAEHLFYSAIIAYDMAKELGEDNGTAWQCMFVAAVHDFDEAVLSDIPYLVKRHLDKSIIGQAMDELDYLPPMVPKFTVQLGKLAELIELKLFLEEERCSGNRSLHEIEQETMHRVFEALYDIQHPEADKLQQYVEDLIEPVAAKAPIDDMVHELGYKR